MFTLVHCNKQRIYLSLASFQVSRNCDGVRASASEAAVTAVGARVGGVVGLGQVHLHQATHDELGDSLTDSDLEVSARVIVQDHLHFACAVRKNLLVYMPKDKEIYLAFSIFDGQFSYFFAHIYFGLLLTTVVSVD